MPARAPDSREMVNGVAPFEGAEDDIVAEAREKEMLPCCWEDCATVNWVATGLSLY